MVAPALSCGDEFEFDLILDGLERTRGESI